MRNKLSKDQRIKMAKLATAKWLGTHYTDSFARVQSGKRTKQLSVSVSKLRLT